MPVKSLIVGVDLAPIKSIPRTISFQDDITTDSCRSKLRGHLQGWRADTVVHDGAPNVGVAWVQDAFSQNELVLASLKLATEFLAPNGTFVTKVFRSKDSAKLEWIFKQLFTRVEQTKPPSSRNVSAETFYICRGFKAPKHLDPRFLDAKHAFAEVESTAVNNEARVFNPEKKRKKREGYDEGDWTQFHEAAASEFVQTMDPIAMLGKLNRLHFRQDGNGDVAQAALDRLPETTEEVRLCCEDLRVLGRKEFKVLLRWRLKARERFGFREKKDQHRKEHSTAEEAGQTKADGQAGEEGVTVESMDDEMRLQEEVQQMKDSQDKAKRKERRKENERKQKEIVRMQMGMTTPSDIGIDAAEGGDATFRLKDVDKAGDVRRQIVRGRMVGLPSRGEEVKDEGEGEEEGEGSDEEDGDELEKQLDNMYEDYQVRKEDRDTKTRAKRVRREAHGEDGEEFEGFDGEDKAAETDASSDASLIENESADDFGGDSDGDGRMMTDLQQKKEGTLSGRAASFFQQDIFKDMGGLEDDIDMDGDSGVDVGSGSPSPELKSQSKDASLEVDESDDDAAESDAEARDEEIDDSEMEEVPTVSNNEADGEWEGSRNEKPDHEKDRPNINIITAEAMTLAHALATGKTTTIQLTDDNFNKYSHRSMEGLPDWFLDDENKHSRPQRPISAEAAQAVKEKLRALNARPIKKVREAKARKTLRAARRLEKLKKKSEGLAEGGEGSERDKARDISKLMAKAKKGRGGKKGKKEVKVVRAGGANKGAGRPKGVKGKYKMVDSRLKKDVRGEKRAKKKIKGGR